jgi:hypothetical protein
MKSVNLNSKVLMEGDMILIFELWNLHKDTLLSVPWFRHLAFGTMIFYLVTFTWDFDLL